MAIFMSDTRHKTNRDGVYYREAKTRKHKGRLDRTYCYEIRDESGRKKYINVGRASQGITEELAWIVRVDALSKRNTGEHVETAREQKGKTLDRIMAAYMDWRKAEGKYTAQEQSRYDKHIKPAFGALPISHITLDRLDKFKADKLPVLAPSSVKKLFILMRAAINHAISRKLYKGPNPVEAQAGFSAPREDNEAKRFLTKEEAEKLLAELEKRSTQLYHMAFVALYTGMRSTEIFGLKGSDIDENNSLAVITAKGRKREVVHLHERVLAILIQYRTRPDALLFPDTNGNRYKNTPDTFSRAVAALGMASDDNKQRVIFHTLRHTFASWLAQSGKVTLLELKEIMRHKRIETTIRYAHFIPGEQRKKLSVLDSFMPD